VTQQKLVDQVRDAIRVKHYSPRTEEAYWNWIKRFIIFHNKRHPNDMAESEISSFLSDLAVNKRISASTQNPALSAILFLYNEVLKKPLDWIDNISRAKRPIRLPVVFTRQEVQSILRNLDGTKWLMASLLYGAGLRLTECLRLRVKDLDFGYGQLIVRDGKGGKDRITVMKAQAKLWPLIARARVAGVLHPAGSSVSLDRCGLNISSQARLPISDSPLLSSTDSISINPLA